MSTRKERLTPVKVPWMVSPSAPHLPLAASESQSDGSAISFIAHFGLEHLQGGTEEGVKKVLSPYGPHSRLGPLCGPFQLIRIELVGQIAGRILPGFSDSEELAPERYDMSAIPCGYTPGQSIDDWLRHFQDTWKKQGSCPDPRMYEIPQSLWIRELGASQDYKHILVIGHDAYVEAVVKNWQWISEGSVAE